MTSHRESEFTTSPDFRPSFDKSDYKGTVAAQANPWFPINERPTFPYGGPNLTWKRYECRDAWANGMGDVLPYGLSVLALEVNEPVSWIGTWTEALKQFEKSDVPIKLGLFYGLYSDSPDKTLAELKKHLLPIREKLLTSPHVARVGGRPAFYVYGLPGKRAPKEWGTLFERIDAEICPMAYFLDVAWVAVMAARAPGPSTPEAVDARFEKLVREYLPYFDGVSGYGTGYRIPQRVLRKVMGEYPQKVFEVTAHFAYLVHFAVSGTDVHLSETWRQHLDECVECEPDAIMLTNFYDHYENSLVFPCYDREDFALRYFEWRTAKWRKRQFRRRKEPELVVTGNYVAQLGVTPLEFEVLGFPIDNAQRDVVLHLDLCDTAGKPIYSFPDRKMRLEDDVKVESFSVSSIDFAQYRGVVARLKYDWAGFKMTMNYTPMTVIDPSIRGYRLYWARSTKNELLVGGEKTWKMDLVGPGGTRQPRNGRVFISNSIKPNYVHWDKFRTGHSLTVLRRDGEEYPGGIASPVLPPPGGALHWYNVELENANGCKYMSLPIWEANETRSQLVKMNVPNGTNGIAEVEIEESRIPFWDFRMTEDTGTLLLDESGWEHHGFVCGTGFGGGHLGHTGYHHLHYGGQGLSGGGRSLFRRDADGTGYLAFNGSNDYVMVMGGTAFPGSATYELKVRPAEFGREMGLIGSGMGQMNIDLLKDGTLRVSRKAKGGVAEVVSKDKLPMGVWSRVAAVYDLKNLSLYINGCFVGSVVAEDAGGMDFFSEVIIGSQDKHPWTPVGHFKGDIGHVRMTGRNLSEEELQCN